MHSYNKAEDIGLTLSHPIVAASTPWHRLSVGDWDFDRIDPPGLGRSPVALFDELEREYSALSAASDSARGVAGAHGAGEGRAVEGDSIRQSDLNDLALQTWRLQKRIEGLDEVEHKRIRKQLSESVRRFSKLLERFEMEYEDPAGKPYSTGWLEVEVVSWEELGERVSPVESGPWIHEVISPILRRHGRMVRKGEVVCIDPDC